MVDIEQIIASGESLRVEFKKQLSANNKKAICKEIAALATGRGGTLLIGVDDDRSVAGLEEPQLVIDQIEQWVPSHVAPLPDIDCAIHELNEKKIVVISVNVGHSRSPIYSYDGTFYGRVNTSSRPLTVDQVADILRGITLEDTLASLQAGLASVGAQAASATYAVSPGIIGQGDLATQSYDQVSARLLHDLLSSPQMMAVRSTIALAESMAAVAMHSTAPAILGQGDLATANYTQIRDRLFGELGSATALLKLQSDVATATTTSMMAQSCPAPSIVGQSDLATMSYSVFVDRLVTEPKLLNILARVENAAYLAQNIASQAQSAAIAASNDISNLKRALTIASS